MQRQQWNKTIAITGAGSGFGAAIAHLHASRGWNVAVTDIHEQRAVQTLSELDPGGDHFFLQLDITRQDHWQRLQDMVLQKWGGLEVLVNNAGVAAAGNMEETSLEDWDWVLDIDLMGVVRGCHQFARLLKQQGDGHIVNISSFAGIAGLPGITAYGVAKAGVIAVSEALRAEMHPHGVGVTVACPAFVKTGLLESFRTSNPKTKAKVNHWMETSGVSATEVAEKIATAVENNTFMLLTHSKTRTAWRIKRWFPALYYRLITKRTSS